MDVARQTALALLETVLAKRLAFDDSFARAAEPLSPQDRGFVRQLTATTLRRLGQIDDLIDGCLQKPLPPAMPVPRDILRLGVAQLLISPLWLRSYTMGPLEWLWRYLTYGKAAPLRKQGSSTQAI